MVRANKLALTLAGQRPNYVSKLESFNELSKTSNILNVGKLFTEPHFKIADPSF